MATITLTLFQPDTSPQTADQALKSSLKTMAQAKHCAVLWFADINARKLFRKLGYASIYQYADKELGFCTSRTGDFLRLARKLEELPHLKQELATGKIGYTKAREIIKVAEVENELQWLSEARNNSRDELAYKVRKARKEAAARKKENPGQGRLLAAPEPTVPVAATRHRVTLDMTTEQFARYEALLEKLHQRGGVAAGAGRAELILAAMASLCDSADLTRGESKPAPPVQIHVHKCPECERASITTNRGDVPLAAVELSRLECDARVAESGRPNRSTIPPSVRREVLARDRHRCQAPGCPNTRFLEVHHITSRRLGGSNEVDNLITLCGACHQLLHEFESKGSVAPGGQMADSDSGVSHVSCHAKQDRGENPACYTRQMSVML